MKAVTRVAQRDEMKPAKLLAKGKRAKKRRKEGKGGDVMISHAWGKSRLKI